LFAAAAVVGLVLTVGPALAARRAEPVPILMYHVIAAPPTGAAYPDLFVRPADFSAEMQWLAQHGYHAVTLRQVYDHWRDGRELPRRPIVVSFDDGYLSVHTTALTVLDALQWPGVLNLSVKHLDSPYNLPPWRVRNLIAAGWEIDAHTISHLDLTTVDDKRLWHEVHGSRVATRRMFHVRADFFCYPSGRYDARVIDAVQRAGFLGATTTRYGLAWPTNLFVLSRIRIDGHDGLGGFVRKLEGLPPSPY